MDLTIYDNYTEEQLDEILYYIHSLKQKNRTKKTSITIKERYANDEVFREYCKQKALQRYYTKIKPNKI